MFVAGKKRKGHSKVPAARSVRLREDLSKSAHARGSATRDVQQREAEVNKWYRLGIENAREQQHRAALDYYNRAVALATNEGLKMAKLYEARSHTLYRLGEHQRAMVDAKEAIHIDENSAAGFARMATILAATGKAKEALAVIHKGLETVDPHVYGYAHLETLRMSVMQQLDPSYVPAVDPRTDPFRRLPEELAILILLWLDTRALVLLRGVARHWLSLIDNAPALWSRPCYASLNISQRLTHRLPAYTKLRSGLQQSKSRVPDRALRHVFEKSRGGLALLHFPDGSAPSSATLEVLFAHRRPRMSSVVVDCTAVLDAPVMHRILNLCMSPQISEIRLPYRCNLNNDVMAAIACSTPTLRILDISGCVNVNVKHLFRAWGTTLSDALGSTMMEELYLNDHPGIPELLVYSAKYSHFRNLKVLHIAIRDQTVFSLFTGLGSLFRYFLRIPDAQVPFPNLMELNIDGLWDTTISSRRFESSQTSLLVSRCRLLCTGLHRLSALESSSAGQVALYSALERCFSTLRKLHLTRAMGLSTQMLLRLTSTQQALPLVSLDLSGCVGIDAHGLAVLVSCCRDLVYVNLSQTATDNSVLSKLTEIINMSDNAGLEVLALDTTDITGVAVRDFASACAKRYCRIRSSGQARHPWRLQLLDIDNCTKVGSDAVAVARDMLSFMRTRILASIAD
ncbi:hypothetical protein H4R20_000650 [Coemansia guatemalensis]|uniref:F-box domain-containing protein n=1 Tax=Coemansia guatemalensis TaxID=2761395 RepID=A0A9W8I130_9FUNG|nr:hypothetical protein H4R20_000650 [Coemansia guatemalensis]